LQKIISAVRKNEPVTFILPAFPGKSPNPEKVLGTLPDFAEILSLKFLGKLCEQIKKIYAPGMKIILCSDGRVFSDVVGMNESNVTAYQNEINRLIKELSLTDVSVFNLDHFYNGLHFEQMRVELMKSFGQSLEFLKQKIRNGAQPTATPEEQESNRMYSGITRFLFEDAMHAGQTKTRSAVQKDAKARAYEVIRRSNAWSKLLFEYFPEAVRLSIHPQTCGSKKLGIRLIGNESWMTPWHGVAVEGKNGYTLLKRSEAEALGAKLVLSSDGQPSHYKLSAEA
jgi:pyoverdine/dityrosine biosynthesis protein Dit1